MLIAQHEMCKRKHPCIRSHPGHPAAADGAPWGQKAVLLFGDKEMEAACKPSRHNAGGENQPQGWEFSPAGYQQLQQKTVDGEQLAQGNFLQVCLSTKQRICSQDTLLLELRTPEPIWVPLCSCPQAERVRTTQKNTMCTNLASLCSLQKQHLLCVFWAFIKDHIYYC